ncbi:hypothetical protein AT2G07654 [Arabidopsis thaliana]|uniref:Uncharacterized protein n=1 Tax=Arabidopsis thaliana TaxID=3702 RepID=A0A1P8B2V1_ARATH|nr:uncharacterized protein AT2G07654 [Arabidopsis thaliana]ANM63229.1 hypothetical protein AT2G07654 [Arabidopsis thaliana]|eukprot:NP_001325333.1 hypothetical protein AT2G07654 [Arabidopsis thaliana]
MRFSGILPSRLCEQHKAKFYPLVSNDINESSAITDFDYLWGSALDKGSSKEDEDRILKGIFHKAEALQAYIKEEAYRRPPHKTKFTNNIVREHKKT